RASRSHRPSPLGLAVRSRHTSASNAAVATFMRCRTVSTSPLTSVENMVLSMSLTGVRRRFVKDYHLGNKGIDGSDICQTTSCGELTKILVSVTLIIWLIIILRKKI